MMIYCTGKAFSVTGGFFYGNKLKIEEGIWKNFGDVSGVEGESNISQIPDWTQSCL